jgi:hypothetical protein
MRRLFASRPTTRGSRGNSTRIKSHIVADETKTIELWPCRYDARCSVKNCRAKATTLARGVDNVKYELCHAHAEQVAVREKGRGREVVRREIGK